MGKLKDKLCSWFSRSKSTVSVRCLSHNPNRSVVSQKAAVVLIALTSPTCITLA